jgi:hypothetical protein
VVLRADVVETEAVGQLGLLDQLRIVIGVRGQGDPEFDRSAVVRHRDLLRSDGRGCNRATASATHRHASIRFKLYRTLLQAAERTSTSS